MKISLLLSCSIIPLAGGMDVFNTLQYPRELPRPLHVAFTVSEPCLPGQLEPLSMFDGERKRLKSHHSATQPGYHIFLDPDSVAIKGSNAYR